MSYRECVTAGKSRLESAGLECADPLLHMKQIIEAAAQIDAAELLRRWESPLPADLAERIELWILRRLKGEPFQYIAGYEWFWDLKFAVGQGVLIPRPETEHVIETALRRIPDRPLRIAELGAGTGILGITLLQNRPWEWWAWEKHPEALPYLKHNLKLLPKGARYHVREEDFFDGIKGESAFEWFVSNPPYVATGELPGLSKEVRHEPPLALDGGPTGLVVIEKLIETAAKKINPSGGVIFEMGEGQASEVTQLLKKYGFRDVSIEKDLAGRDRVASAVLNP